MNPHRLWPATIRVKLTLHYAVAFFIAGAVLVGVIYFSLGQALDHRPAVSSDTPGHLTPEQRDVLIVQFEQNRDDTLGTMLIASLIALGAVGVAAGAAGWLLAGRAL